MVIENINSVTQSCIDGLDWQGTLLAIRYLLPSNSVLIEDLDKAIALTSDFKLTEAMRLHGVTQTLESLVLNLREGGENQENLSALDLFAQALSDLALKAKATNN